LVGDVAQLPSVGAGYVLHELMHCKHVPHVSLTKIYRQDGHSDIVEVAHAILNEKTVDTNFRKDSEFLFIQTKADEVIQEISKLTSLMKEKSNLTFQVIAPVYDGELGVNNLNKNLREILNPNFSRKNCSKIKHGDTDMYEGDRIMVIKNNYDKMIFNGDTGKIQRISIKNDEVEVKIFNWFDSESKIPRYVDKTFIFKIEEARSILKVAYACTTHRYQGNEIDYVIMPMTMKYGIMLYKNLIYTAITRAKKKVFIFGDPQAFQFAIKNDRETIRNSNLSKLIQV
jgi:exodeoxyribonuclease V alpha subunit